MGDASKGNLTSLTKEHVARQPASSLAIVASDDNVHDYIMIEDLHQDMATNDDGGGDGDEDASVKDPRGAELMVEIANYFDEYDILFGNPRWLENFKEMKQAVVDSLYKGYLKHWTMLHFDL